MHSTFQPDTLRSVDCLNSRLCSIPACPPLLFSGEYDPLGIIQPLCSYPRSEGNTFSRVIMFDVSLPGGVNERARVEIADRRKDRERDAYVTTHRSERERPSGSKRSSRDDRDREPRRHSDREHHRDHHSDRSHRIADRGLDRRSDRSDRDRAHRSERSASESRSGSGWESSTPLRRDSGAEDEWETTPAVGHGRAGSTAPSPSPWNSRGGSTPLIRAGSGSRGMPLS